MDFKILTNLDGIEIYEGMLINYIVKPLFGIPLKWQTEISTVDKPNIFIDKQISGPYSIWEHTHIFREQNGGVLMIDEVKYKLPLGFIGDLTHKLIVKKKVENIFSFRKAALEKIFSK